MEEEEAEIARLEAEARVKVEEVAESESSGENTEDTQVQYRRFQTRKTRIQSRNTRRRYRTKP